MKSLPYLLVLSALLFSFNLPNEEPSSIKFNTNPSGKERIMVLNASYEIELINLINQYRQKNRLESLEVNSSLMQASRYHAADMANEDYFEHATHNRIGNRLQRGLSTFKRIKQFYDGFANTENCGAGYSSPEAVFNGWVNSPGHNANLLNKSATHIGVGFYQTNHSAYKRYWVFVSSVE
jgi:uncharacterized protein YkwD